MTFITRFEKPQRFILAGWSRDELYLEERTRKELVVRISEKARSLEYERRFFFLMILFFVGCVH